MLNYQRVLIITMCYCWEVLDCSIFLEVAMVAIHWSIWFKKLGYPKIHYQTLSSFARVQLNMLRVPSHPTDWDSILHILFTFTSPLKILRHLNAIPSHDLAWKIASFTGRLSANPTEHPMIFPLDPHCIPISPYKSLLYPYKSRYNYWYNNGNVDPCCCWLDSPFLQFQLH